MTAPCDAYILCASPRSGSTMLCKMLSATGVAGHPKSYFHVPSLENWLEYFDLPPDLVGTAQAARDRVFQAALARGRGQTSVFGTRLQRGSFVFFTDQLAAHHPDAATDRARIEATFGQTQFIHLTREDTVAQAVSFVKAQQSGLWHQAPDGTDLERLSAPRALVYDVSAVAEVYHRFVAFERAWLSWFDAQGIVPLRVTYQALDTAPHAVLAQVLSFLGQDPKRAEDVVLGTRRLADAVNDDWIARARQDLGL